MQKKILSSQDRRKLDLHLAEKALIFWSKKEEHYKEKFPKMIALISFCRRKRIEALKLIIEKSKVDQQEAYINEASGNKKVID